MSIYVEYLIGFELAGNQAATKIKIKTYSTSQFVLSLF